MNIIGLDTAYDRVQRLRDELIDQQNEMIEQAVTERLEKLGYHFEDNAEFLKFATDRLTGIQMGEVRQEIWLDYVSPKQPGDLIAAFSTVYSMNVSNDGGFAELNIKIE